MKTFKASYFYLFLFCIQYNFSYSQEDISKDSVQTERWNVDKFDINDGLKQMQINDIHKSQDGKIWIGSRSGICIFNGINFDCLEDLVGSPYKVIDIDELSDGTIVILGPTGLYFFDGVTFVKKDISQDVQYKYGSTMYIDSEDRVFINYKYDADKNFIYHNGEFEKYVDFFQDISSLDIQYIVPGKQASHYFIFSKEGVFFKRNNNIDTILYLKNRPGLEYIKKNYKNSNQLIFTTSATKSSYVLSLKDGNIELLYNGTRKEYNRASLKKLEGMPFVHDEGLLQYIDNKLVYLTEKTTEYHNLLCLEMDGQDVFLGTDMGLVRYRKSPFHNYTQVNLPYIWTINETEEDIILGSYNGGVYKMRDKEEIKIQNNYLAKKDKELFDKSLNRIYCSSVQVNTNEILLAYDRGILKLKDEVITNFYPENLNNTSASLYLHYDEKKRLIFRATCPGVEIIDPNGALIEKIDSSIFLHNCILTVAQQDEDNYWFGTTGGVTRYNYKTKQTKNYEHKEGNFPMPVAVTSLIDRNGDLWFGGSNGIVKYDAQADTFLQIDGLRNYLVNDMLQYDSQKTFLATNKGLLMIDLLQLSEKNELVSKLFSGKDGMLGLELGQNGFFQDSNNRIWTTSYTDPVSFDPNDLSFESSEQKVVINTINGHRLSFGGNKIQLEAGINDVTIEYGTQRMSEENTCLYRYRLNQKKWSSWSNSKLSRFTNLSSGTYTFSVQIKNKFTTDEAQSTSKGLFQVNIPFYKEPYFKTVLGFLLLSMAFFTAYMFRNNKLQKEINGLLSDENEQLVFEKAELANLNQNLKKRVEEKSIESDLIQTPRKTIELKIGVKKLILELDQIIYITAENTGIRIYLESTKHWSDTTLKQVETKLPKDRFLRVYRSTIININHVEWLDQSTIQMKDGSSHKIGRTYKKEINNRFTK